MKKKIIIIIVLLSICLVPIKRNYKDGGTVEYKSILYSVKKYHIMNSDDANSYSTGWKISILGITVYDEIN